MKVNTENEDVRYLERLGATLRKLRHAANVTQSELSIRMGVTQSMISEMENGNAITLPNVRRYVHCLGFDFKITMEKIYVV